MVLHGAMFVLAVRARVEHPILYLKVRVYSIEIQIKTDEHPTSPNSRLCQFMKSDDFTKPEVVANIPRKLFCSIMLKTVRVFTAC